MSFGLSTYGVTSFGFGPSQVVQQPPTGDGSIRALVMISDRISQIPDAMVGTGKKPLVLYQGRVGQRVAAEGIAVVLVAGVIRTLASNETLKI